MFQFDVASLRRPRVPAVVRRWTGLAALSVGIMACSTAATVEAGLVLQSGTGALQFSQGSSGSLDLVINNTGSSSAFVNSFWAGVQLVADNGVTGSLSLFSATAPLTGSLLSDDPAYAIASNTLTGATSVGGTDYIQVLGSNNTNFENSLSAAAIANLAALTFTATGDALGTWTLYGVNQSGSSVSFVANGHGDQTDFDNLPAADDTTVALATITIVAASVPEIDPGTGSLAFTLVAAALGLAEARLRRSRALARLSSHR